VEHTNPSYRSGDRKRGCVNGLVTDHLEVTIPSGAVVGDTILLSSVPWDHLHSTLSLQSEGAAGLTLDIGARTQDGSTDDPTFFAGGLDASAVGVQETMDHPKKFVDADDVPKQHQIYLTITGAVTPGDRFWVINAFRSYGMNNSL